MPCLSHSPRSRNARQRREETSYLLLGSAVPKSTSWEMKFIGISITELTVPSNLEKIALMCATVLACSCYAVQ